MLFCFTKWYIKDIFTVTVVYPGGDGSSLDCQKIVPSHNVGSFKDCMETATAMEANMARYNDSKHCLLWQCKATEAITNGKDKGRNWLF